MLCYGRCLRKPALSSAPALCRHRASAAVPLRRAKGTDTGASGAGRASGSGAHVAAPGIAPAAFDTRARAGSGPWPPQAP